jgi:hypothetical protein
MRKERARLAKQSGGRRRGKPEEGREGAETEQRTCSDTLNRGFFSILPRSSCCSNGLFSLVEDLKSTGNLDGAASLKAGSLEALVATCGGSLELPLSRIGNLEGCATAGITGGRDGAGGT